MLNKNFFSISLLLGVAVILFSTCKKREFDAPPVRTIAEGKLLNIDSLKQIFQRNGGLKYYFTDDYSLYATVTADEVSGNLYKNVFIQDSMGAINMRLQSSGGLYEGDYIRINLKGAFINQYNGMLQLDSVHVDNQVVKLKTNVAVIPDTVTVGQITTNYQSRLIILKNVQFIPADTGSTYADAVNQQDESRTIEDCNGKTIIVRTSGYANFAGDKVATGGGSLIAIVSEYNGTMQLVIRKLADVMLNSGRCIEYLKKNFEDNSITSGGWTNYNVSGSVNWKIGNLGSGHSGQYYAQCSNYSGGNNFACETWYISPSVDLSGSVSPVLSFINAYNYSGPKMQVYVSTNYTSGNPTSAAWTELTFTASTGSWNWVNSGNVSLSSFKAANVHVAFKYTGSNSDGSTWEMDEVIIKEN